MWAGFDQSWAKLDHDWCLACQVCIVELQRIRTCRALRHATHENAIVHVFDVEHIGTRFVKLIGGCIVGALFVEWFNVDIHSIECLGTPLI